MEKIYMKKLLIIAVVFALGVLATEAFGQVRVQVQGPSVVVQPPGYNVRVNVPQYYRVQPRPYVVTPIVTPPPPKPLFWTPLRNMWWKAHHKPSVHYHVRPYVPSPGYQPMPYRVQ